MTKLSKTKFFAGVTAAALLAVSVAGAGGTAFADAAEQTLYPEIFTESIYDNVGEITDYAVGASAVAVASGNKVTVIAGDEIQSYDFSYNVRALDCTTGGGDVFYCLDAAGNAYTLPDKAAAEHDFSFGSFTIGNYMYYTFEDEIYSLKLPADAEKVEGCSNLKQYGGSAYVLKDNKINTLEGTALQVVPLNYTDFKAAGRIAVGETPAKLKAVGDVQFVMLKAGTYRTEIDLDDLSGRYFETGATTPATEGETALLLCKTGNAAVVVNGSKRFITLASNVEVVARDAEDDAEFAATVCVPFDYVYSSPVLVEGTKLQRIDWGAEINVLSRLSAEYSPELECDFYKITYTNDGGESATGYIPCSFVTEKKTDDGELTEITDPAYTNEDPTKTVLITVLVISLILVAVGYLIFVGTSGKNKKNKKSKDNKSE